MVLSRSWDDPFDFASQWQAFLASVNVIIVRVYGYMPCHTGVAHFLTIEFSNSAATCRWSSKAVTVRVGAALANKEDRSSLRAFSDSKPCSYRAAHTL